MDTIAARIEGLMRAEYGRSAPPHFQRDARELLRNVSRGMRESLVAEVSRGNSVPLSKSAIGHFPLAGWSWGSQPEPVLTSTVEHFKRELPLVVRTLPDAFAVDAPHNTYLTLTRGAVHWYKDTPGPLSAYHLYLTPEQFEELKGCREESARDFFISSRYIPARLYETSWPLSAGGMDFKRELSVALGPVQIQEAKRWAHLPVIFYVSTNRAKPINLRELVEVEESGEMILPPDPSGEELIAALVELENVLEGKELSRTGQQELLPPEEVESTKLPAAMIRAMQHFTHDLAPLYSRQKSSVPDFVKDGEGRRQMQEELDADKTLILHDGNKAAWAVPKQYVRDEGERKLEVRGGPLDDDALVKARPSDDDIIRAGLSEISLGVLGTEIELALLTLAWEQRNDGGPLGMVKLKSWNQLCRTINPDFDRLKRGPRNNYRRRVRRKVFHMRRLRSLLSYNQLGRERYIDTEWVSFLDDDSGGNTVYIRPGFFDNLYVVATAIAAFHIGRRLTSRNEKTLFWRLWGETSGTFTRRIAVLVEWGDWRSFDREQNRRSLARALDRFVELGYLKERTLTTDGESYRLVKATGHHFPPKLIEGEKPTRSKKSAGSRPGARTSPRPKKAYPRKKRRRQLLPRDGE